LHSRHILSGRPQEEFKENENIFESFRRGVIKGFWGRAIASPCKTAKNKRTMLCSPNLAVLSRFRNSLHHKELAITGDET
jgi:hypothetical protein